VSPIERYSLALSLGVAGVAVGLVIWQVLERRWRPEGLADDDVKHFAYQDLRRGLVAAVMLLLAAGVYVGARLEPGVAGRPNPRYVGTWVGVLALVVLLLVLAMLDWSATRRYAARHRLAIAREGLEILRDEMRRRAAERTAGARGEPSDRHADGSDQAG
jgi:hypothetical protein